MENKVQFGKLIIWLRERDGLSQKELAEKLYVVPSTVCKWEKGGSVPDSEKLKLISEFFQIPYEDLLDPETTLLKIKSIPVMSQLEQESRPEQEPQLEQESKPEQEPKSKRKRYWWICIAAVVTFVVICIAGAISGAHSQSDEWMIQDTYEQYIDDSVFGMVYEIAYVVDFFPDTEVLREFENDQVLTYLQQLELETDIVKVSYYGNKAALEKGENPGRYSYYFLSSYEDD